MLANIGIMLFFDRTLTKKELEEKAKKRKKLLEDRRKRIQNTLDEEEKTKDRNLTEVFQDHLPCSDADKCRVSDLPHGISSNGEQKAGGRAEREFPGAGSSGSLRL